MEKGIQLSGLIFICPFHEDIDTCPFKKVIKLDIDQRMNFINSLSEEEINYWNLKHYLCLAERNSLLRVNKSLGINQISTQNLNTNEK